MGFALPCGSGSSGTEDIISRDKKDQDKRISLTALGTMLVVEPIDDSVLVDKPIEVVMRERTTCVTGFFKTRDGGHAFHGKRGVREPGVTE